MTEPEPSKLEGEKAPIPAQHARGPVERDGHLPFPVVGIGASAGGLEAFRGLLSALPEDTGMAFLLVQHLDPHHESRLGDLLMRATPMPVLEAQTGLAIRPNHVYIIAPNSNMAIAQGVLVLTSRSEAKGPHLPVDYLFRSLAEEQQGRAIGVILSGTGSDGTLGLCEIKAVGGITFAQEEQSAGHSGMPRSAVDSGCVDFVLPVEEIARRLTEIGGHPYLSSQKMTQRFQEAHTEVQYKRILGTVRTVKGVDFSQYRDTTIKRRIMRRMALHTQKSLEEYAAMLEGDRDETEALYQDLLINVTSFFRDPDMFEALKHVVYPEIVKAKYPTAPIRVWVPGCSTGQEAYSIAMTLVEFLDDRPARPPIQVFATDLSDQASLERARAGIYPESIESEVTPERLRRFFRREDHVYRIDKSLRDMCVFARQNVTADPPFSHLDLISCRNVLIYLASPLQRRVLPTFHYALNSPGYLVLGSAETVGDNTDLFDLVDRNNKIYSKKATAARLPIRFPSDEYKVQSTVSRRSGPSSPSPVDFQRETDRLMLSRFTPPGVLVNENLDVVQFRGRTSMYFEVPPGEPTTNVLKMAREGLLIDLRNALTEAKKRREPVRREKVRVHSNGGVHQVSLDVFPIQVHGAESACYLVLFQEEGDRPAVPESPVPGPVDLAALPDVEREIARLRQELSATKEYMQSLVEQQDAANEELRSANEEILSSNEELQSTNEELETAKEELQSANEELTTVNEQLQHRNVELSQVNNDLTNLLSSTNIPVVMVGPDLCIRRFTQPARKVMNLLPTDVGRSIGDLKPSVNVPDLDRLIGEVIETVQPREREVLADDNIWFAVRIYPYRTSDHKIDGAVIVLVDIDQNKRAQELLREADRRKDEFLATLAHELRNPIAPIRNAIEIMRLSGQDGEALQMARDVLGRQVHQLSRIVDDLIDLSRIVERKTELRPTRVVLDNVIEMAVETSRDFIDACRHRLVVSLPPRPVHLNADPARLAQVFVNLLNNAAKYMKPGGRIWLSAERIRPQTSGTEEVRISVRDIGSGIPVEMQSRIFDMFTQGYNEVEHARGGLGIGLTLARNLVEMHDGRIEAHSAGVGLGSEFVVYLPVAPRGLDGLATPPAAAEPSVPEKIAARRILVVDDNMDQAQSLKKLLELHGHQVEVALDGASALQVIEKFSPDFALIDIGLPGMSGYEIARRIRERSSLDQTTLVAQTGWGQDHDRKRSEDAGFDHHLVKPVNLEALNRVLAHPRRPS